MTGMEQFHTHEAMEPKPAAEASVEEIMREMEQQDAKFATDMAAKLHAKGILSKDLKQPKSVTPERYAQVRRALELLEN